MFRKIAMIAVPTAAFALMLCAANDSASQAFARGGRGGSFSHSGNFNHFGHFNHYWGNSYRYGWGYPSYYGYNYSYPTYACSYCYQQPSYEYSYSYPSSYSYGYSSPYWGWGYGRYGHNFHGGFGGGHDRRR